MERIHLYNKKNETVTCVPNTFIDLYMPKASGEFVKIFLYLLRSIRNPGNDCSISGMADHFDLTEKDIMRALRYWETAGLLKLEYSPDGPLTGICMISEALQEKEETSVHKDLHIHATSSAEPPAIPAGRAKEPVLYTPAQLSSFCEQDDVAEMVFMAERYIGRSLNHTDLNTIFSWYDQLHFPLDLIEFLIETCVSGGHTSLRYMQKIAEDFDASGIHTVDQARAMLDSRTGVCRAVMKSFGIKGRSLAPAEMDFIKRWSTQMGFSAEMIEAACNKTIQAIHEPGFEYTDRILSRWKEQGVSTPADIQKADEAFAASRKPRQASAKTARVKSTQFANFKQRENNYDELQKQLLRQSIQ